MNFDKFNIFSRDKLRLQKKRYREKALKRKQSEKQNENINNTSNNPSTTVSSNRPKAGNARRPVNSAEKQKDDKRKKFEEFSKK